MKWLGTLGVRMAQAMAAAFLPLPIMRAVLTDPFWTTALAPLLVCPLIFWLEALVQAFHYPHIDLAAVVLGPVTSAVLVVGTLAFARACAWLAQRWTAGASRRETTDMLTVCGVYGMSPVVVVAILFRLLDLLEDRAGSPPGALGPLAAWLQSPWLVLPGPNGAPYGDRAQWVAWIWCGAVTTLALWRALPQVDARIRRRFGLVWLAALALLIARWWAPG